jgi:hypothetical protein
MTAKDETIPASTDMKIRNWHSKSGERLKTAILDAENWLKEVNEKSSQGRAGAFS